METLGVWHYAIRESLVLGIDAALSMNDRGTANELLIIAERLPNIRGVRFLPAHILRFRARMAEGDGDPELIAAGFEHAALWFREIRHQFSLGVTLLEHGEWLEREGQISSAAPLVVEARAVFQQLGCRRVGGAALETCGGSTGTAHRRRDRHGHSTPGSLITDM